MRPPSELLTLPRLRARLGEAGRMRAQELFTWERVTAQLADVYQEVWARRAAAAHSSVDLSPLLWSTTDSQTAT